MTEASDYSVPDLFVMPVRSLATQVDALQVLEGLEDPRAVLARAEAIVDEPLRQAYLQDVAAHREIGAAFGVSSAA